MKPLPPEILMHIAEAVVDQDAVAFPAHHAITRTLFSFLTVSQAASNIARSLLLAHCLYIDSDQRLKALIRCLEANGIRDHLDRRAKSIQKLFLKPFTSNTINERSVVDDIYTLFHIVGPVLRKVVVDIPFRSYYPDEDRDTQIRPVMRDGFERLHNVEEFISVNDELYLDTLVGVREDLVWTHWSKLRYLALYNLEISLSDRASPKALVELPELEIVILARPDWDRDGIQELYRNVRKPTHIAFLNTPFEHNMDFDEENTPDPATRSLTPTRETVELKGTSCQMLHFHKIDVDPGDPSTSTFAHNPKEKCQRFLRERGLDRSLWRLL